MGAEMNERETLKLALEALEFYYDLYKEKVDANAITAIKEALAQPKQEPVAWLTKELMANYLDTIAEAIEANRSEMLRHKANKLRDRGEV